MKTLPKRALTDTDLQHYARAFGVHNFRGVFMRTSLPRKPRVNESAIVNLDSSDGPGTHWVAYKKLGNRAEYYDSFGDLRPPIELRRYLDGAHIYYNYENEQRPNTVNCGHLALRFLLSPSIKVRV